MLLACNIYFIICGFSEEGDKIGRVRPLVCLFPFHRVTFDSLLHMCIGGKDGRKDLRSRPV